MRGRLPSVAARYDRFMQIKANSIDYPRRWRRSDAAGRLSRYAGEFGWSVVDGPFRGLSYPPLFHAWVGDVASKLSGSYEAGIHELIERVVAWQPDHVIDIGAAEGYYAVGFARRIPGARVIASDIDPVARALCRLMSRHNRVGDRVHPRPAFTPAMVARLSGRLAFFFDCEGAERELVDPVLVPSLTDAMIVVELHEFIHRDILAVLRARFADSHEVIVHGEAPFRPALHRLAAWPQPDVRRLLDERRPEPMRWAALHPRG
jgi:hypothetical protein